MSLPRLRGRASVRAPLIWAASLWLLSGCSFWREHTPFHHRTSKVGCTEPAFVGNTDARAPLVVPAGLSAPDTRGSVKIPELTQPERLRASTEPCLADPPRYGSYVARPLVRPVLPSTSSLPLPSSVPPVPPAASAPESGVAK